MNESETKVAKAAETLAVKMSVPMEQFLTVEDDGLSNVEASAVMLTATVDLFATAICVIAETAEAPVKEVFDRAVEAVEAHVADKIMMTVDA
jgi:hypothetical protein